MKDLKLVNKMLVNPLHEDLSKTGEESCIVINIPCNPRMNGFSITAWDVLMKFSTCNQIV